MSEAYKKIFVLSQGCAANFGDGEKIARALKTANPNVEISFQFPDTTLKKGSPTNGATVGDTKADDAPVDDAAVDDAPITFYLNVCTVKGNSGAIKLLRSAHDAHPTAPIYITGCAPKDFVEEATKVCPQVRFTSLAEIESRCTGVGVLRESPFVGIVNIEEGCLDACAFCSTHLVKGRLRSFAPDFIVARVRELVADGCLEIQLTGQDCACYGFDRGTNLAELVQKILVNVPGDYRIRLGMGNPRHVLQYQDALLDCFTDSRIYQFIHLPVQSGSDRVLKFMNRRHTAEDYRTLAHAFAKRFSRFTLSTDLIVGHPGEAPEDFEETLQLLQETRPTVCNITRFVARPGTVAARLESGICVPDALKHERSARLFDAFQKIALENNRDWVGSQCTVITEKPGYRANTTIARNTTYRPVALQGRFPAGQKLQVRITGAEPFALLAETIA